MKLYRFVFAFGVVAVASCHVTKEEAVAAGPTVAPHITMPGCIVLKGKISEISHRQFAEFSVEGGCGVSTHPVTFNENMRAYAVATGTVLTLKGIKFKSTVVIRPIDGGECRVSNGRTDVILVDTNVYDFTKVSLPLDFISWECSRCVKAELIVESESPSVRSFHRRLISDPTLLRNESTNEVNGDAPDCRALSP